ncbi:aspartate-semialdehyde dehydrogenase [Psychromonas sp. MME2]|uniref:aspartate-semialdehyde dehydrogenase n=1 Tax=unclassified Psychromonas TaxID=2614957 RepID=UPI00339CEF1C
MKSEYNIALIGDIHGCIETTLEVLVKRDFPVAKVYPLANGETDIETVMFSGKSLTVSNIEEFDWQKVDIAFFLTDIETTQKWADVASEYCIVIDNSGTFSEDINVPLVQIGVNDDHLGRYLETNKIAIPSSESAQLSLAIKQINQEVGLVRVNVASYHSVSVTGKVGVTTLAGETARLLNGMAIESSNFPQQCAFNVFPQVGALDDEGISLSELRLVNEIRSLLNDPAIIVSSTQAVVPMFYGCAQAVHLQTHYPVELDEVAQSLHHSDGIVLAKSVCDYPDMINDVIGNESVQVGRLRKDVCDPCGINLWVCADNIHFGIATNAIMVAEKLIHTYL